MNEKDWRRKQQQRSPGTMVRFRDRHDNGNGFGNASHETLGWAVPTARAENPIPMTASSQKQCAVTMRGIKLTTIS
jgi:hypothetical protein